MKRSKSRLGAATFASIFILAVPIIGAQEVTSPVTTSIEEDDDSGKWGLLGLLGVVGLFGLKRRDHDNHVRRTADR